jgi:VPDSG-CTERM motif
MNKIKYIAAVLIAVAGFGLQQAKADFISTLNVGNSSLSGISGPFGTVTVSLDVATQTATITFTADAGFAFIDTSAAAVQVNSASFTEAIVTDSDFKSFGSGTVDGFGSFNLTVDNKSASTPISSIVFTVTNTFSTLWPSASNVLAFNSLGFDAAAHILVLNGTGLTGFAGENGASVPDGGTTVMLLGAALGALGMARRFLMG